MATQPKRKVIARQHITTVQMGVRSDADRFKLSCGHWHDGEAKVDERSCPTCDHVENEKAPATAGAGARSS